MQNPTDKGTGKYLTFKLAEDIFAVDVSRVVRILDPEKITRIPRTPEFMKGVMNLRGKVLPIVDLRFMLGLEKTNVTKDTCIIVFEVKYEGETLELGTLSDAVQAVMELNASEIEPPPNIGVKLDTEVIEGIGKSGEDFIIILDINKVFSGNAMKLIKQHHSVVQEEEVVTAE